MAYWQRVCRYVCTRNNISRLLLVALGCTISVIAVVNRDCCVVSSSSDKTNALLVTMSSYVGGLATDQGGEFGSGVMVDATGDIIIFGSTSSDDLQMEHPIQESRAGEEDLFVIKLDGVTGNIEFGTYLGGSATEQVYDGILDDRGRLILVGGTLSHDFPVSQPLQSQHGGGMCRNQGAGQYPCPDGFLLTIDVERHELIQSTFIGGSGHDHLYTVDVNDKNQIVIAGMSQSLELATLDQISGSPSGKGDAIVLVVDGAGKEIVGGTFIGGSENDFATDVVIDDDHITVLAVTQSTSLDIGHVVGAFHGVRDLLLVNISGDGQDVLRSEYIGGERDDYGYSMDIGRNNDLFIAGYTKSPSFPIGTPGMTSTNGSGDGFCILISDGIIRKTAIIGGSGDDSVRSVKYDSEYGHLVMVGATTSSDFPRQGEFQDRFMGASEAFVFEMTDELDMQYSSLAGGSRVDYAFSATVQDRLIYVAGETESSDFPVKNAVKSELGGRKDMFVMVIDRIGLVPLVPSPTSTLAPTATESPTLTSTPPATTTPSPTDSPTRQPSPSSEPSATMRPTKKTYLPYCIADESS